MLLICRLGRDEDAEDEDEEDGDESRSLLGFTLAPAEADAGGWKELGGGTVGVGDVVRTSARAGAVDCNRTAAGKVVRGRCETSSLEWRRTESDMANGCVVRKCNATECPCIVYAV